MTPIAEPPDRVPESLPHSTSHRVIYTSAVVFLSPQGEILTARKRGTERFMLIGGKPEPFEFPRSTAVREAMEEVGIFLDASDLELIGMYRAPAANEAGYAVHGTIFLSRHRLPYTPDAAAEIAEVRWLDPRQELPANLAPLLASKVIPLLGELKVIGPTPPARAHLRADGCRQGTALKPPLNWDTDHLPRARFGHRGPLRDALVADLLTGRKRATASLFNDYPSLRAMPQPGELSVLVDSDDQPVAILETYAVKVIALRDIDEDFVADDGANFTSVAHWREVHEDLWKRGPLPDDEPVVCEWVRCYW